MTREEKKKKRIARRDKRNKDRLKRAREFRAKVSHYDFGYHSMPMWAIRKGQNHWPDSNSPTGYSQICNWQGTCQFPCNGDC